LYEDRTIKPDEIVLRRSRREMRKNDGGGVNLTKMHWRYLWKCQNEIFLYS
jgi:hypothetical protein